MQDLPRITDAIASGEIGKQPALQELIALSQASRRHLSPHGPRFARRSAFASGPCGGACENPRRRRRADTGACVDRWPRYTAAIGRRRHGALRQGAATVDTDRAPCAGATIRWTATNAGSGWQRPIRHGGRGGPALSRCGRASLRRPMRTRNSTNSSSRRSSETISGMRDGDGILCFNFRADRVREILAAMLDPAFSGFTPQRVVNFACRRRHDAILGRARRFHGVDLSAAIADEHSRRGRCRRRTHAAAHGGDREISARHLLSQWRPRGAVSRRGSHHGALAEGRDL